MSYLIFILWTIIISLFSVLYGINLTGRVIDKTLQEMGIAKINGTYYRLERLEDINYE